MLVAESAGAIAVLSSIERKKAGLAGGVELHMLNHLTFLLAETDPSAHVWNHLFWKSESGDWLWSSNQGNLVLSAIILIFGMGWVAKHVSTGDEKSQGAAAFVTKNRFAHMIEVICVYLREEVARPLLHDRTDKLMPFLWTLFFLSSSSTTCSGWSRSSMWYHLLKPDWAEKHISPFGNTATQNVWVNGVLAVFAAVVFNGAAAIVRLGVGGYFKHMTGGAPILAAYYFVLELLGQIFIKPVALTVRLFANMTAGHILLATLIGFVGAVWKRGFGHQGVRDAHRLRRCVRDHHPRAPSSPSSRLSSSCSSPRCSSPSWIITTTMVTSTGTTMGTATSTPTQRRE